MSTEFPYLRKTRNFCNISDVSKQKETPVKISAFVPPSHRDKLKEAAKKTGSSISDILFNGSKLALANLDDLKLKPDQRRA